MGPEEGITFQGEEGVFEKNLPTQDETEKESKGSFDVKCRNCGRDHFTHKCPFGSSINLPSTELDNMPPALSNQNSNLASINPSSGLPGKYIPPNRRPDFKTTSEDPDRRQEIGIKVTNLPPEAREPDLFELFGAVGRINKVTLPKNMQTGESRCFAYITYVDKQHAYDALKLNNHRYGNFLLAVELSQNKRRY